MELKHICFDELSERVLTQLKNEGYLDSTLIIYRRFYRRVRKFLNDRGTDFYTEALGKEFLGGIHVAPTTMQSYICSIRRLDDSINGNPYRCHHGNPSDDVTEIYYGVLTGFLEESKNAGNKPYTINRKQKTCTKFLNYIARSGCQDLSKLDTGIISRALLIYNDKDNYAIIRSFLKYIADARVTPTDFSAAVPRYRRHKVLPTTYTPAEIRRVEESVDTSTSTGKRNIAIIMLASRMGIRSGDIAKLKYTEIDFKTGYLNIIQEKTGGPLALQMPQEVSDALMLHLGNLKNLPEDGYVFHSMTAPYGRITTTIIRHIVDEAFFTAGINTDGKKHGPHAFRSSLASSMVNDGGSYETVRKILGHMDPNVIKHYAKTDVEQLRLCAIDPPVPSGCFSDYLSGKKVVSCV